MSGRSAEPGATRSWGLREVFFVACGAAAIWAALVVSPQDRVVAHLLLGVLTLLAAVAAHRRSRHPAAREADARSQGRWPLGEAYDIATAAADDAQRDPVRLRVGETDLEFDEPRAFGKQWRTALREIAAIRVRVSWVEIERRDGQRRRLFPASYADRQRLLWELAVRVPDAFEFAAEDAPPAVPAPPPEPVDLTHTPTGLASALAGPDRSANPPPPRNAGLGCGLFPGAAPAEDDE